MASVYIKLEKALKQAKQPLTCIDLFDKPEIRSSVKDTDQVSNHLGYMFRRGLLTRVPAPRAGVKTARYAYSWRSDADKPSRPVTVEEVKPKRLGGLDIRKQPDGSIVLSSDKLEITVRRK